MFRTVSMNNHGGWMGRRNLGGDFSSLKVENSDLSKVDYSYSTVLYTHSMRKRGVKNSQLIHHYYFLIWSRTRRCFLNNSSFGCRIASPCIFFLTASARFLFFDSCLTFPHTFFLSFQFYHYHQINSHNNIGSHCQRISRIENISTFRLEDSYKCTRFEK